MLQLVLSKGGLTSFFFWGQVFLFYDVLAPTAGCSDDATFVSSHQVLITKVRMLLH